MKINVAKTQLMAMCGHKKKHLEDQADVHIWEALPHKQDSVSQCNCRQAAECKSRTANV